MVDRPAGQQASKVEGASGKSKTEKVIARSGTARPCVCVVGTPGDGNAMEGRGRVTEIKDVPFSLRQRQRYGSSRIAARGAACL